ncbi:MAG: hypothetical protein ACW964_07225 [Candidatus Hodarchaeales archaeon]|jgi:hypothetical protein
MNPDFESYRSEIIALHEKEIEAHMNKNVEFFVKDIADEYVTVSFGEIRKPTLEEIRSQFTSYLTNTVFTKYEDLQEPIIRFSKDGSLAWAIFQVAVKGKRKRDDGSEKNLDFTCAWITLYERQDDKWIRLTDGSSFKSEF